MIVSINMDARWVIDLYWTIWNLGGLGNPLMLQRLNDTSFSEHQQVIIRHDGSLNQNN